MEGHTSAPAAGVVRSIDDHAIFEVVGDAIIVTDPAFTILRWNPGAEQLYGWSAAEAVGQPMSRLVPTLRYLDGGTTATAIATLREKGAWTGMVEQQHRDGRLLMVEGKIRQLLTPERQPLGVVAINRDVSERLALLERERVARYRMEILVAVSRALATTQLELPAVLTAVVRELAIALGDGAMIRLLDESGEQLLAPMSYHTDPAVQQRITQFVSTASMDAASGVTARVLQTGVPVWLPGGTGAAAAPGSEGAELTHFPSRSAIAVPVRYHERMLGVLTLGRTTTLEPYTDDDLQLVQEVAERAALAIENARLYAASQAALQLRDDFLAIAAHELRSPLTALAGHATRLARRSTALGPLSEREQISLRRIVEHSDRLSGLIDDLLDVSRLQRGRLSVAPELLDLGALVREVVGDYDGTVDVHQLTLQLPEAPVQILGDPHRLRQVLSNLLQNAVKYSPGGGVIAVTLAQSTTDAVLSVGDQGLGVPAHDVPHVFERFYRGSNIDSKQIRGFGIGLSLVRTVVAEHGGQVRVASDEGRGSVFSVQLPLVPAAGASDA